MSDYEKQEFLQRTLDRIEEEPEIARDAADELRKNPYVGNDVYKRLAETHGERGGNMLDFLGAVISHDEFTRITLPDEVIDRALADQEHIERVNRLARTAMRPGTTANERGRVEEMVKLMYRANELYALAELALKTSTDKTIPDSRYTA